MCLGDCEQIINLNARAATIRLNCEKKNIKDWEMYDMMALEVIIFICKSAGIIVINIVV